MYAQTIMAMLALLQGLPQIGQKVVNPNLTTNRLETTRSAKLSYIMGVDTADTTCGTYDPAGLLNPIIYRTDSGSGRYVQIFAGDTGLVLVGQNLDLVEKVVLNFDSGQDTDITGTIVSRRSGKTSCGEGATDKVITVRFNIPVTNTTAKKFAVLELFGKTESIAKNLQTIKNPNDPCLPQNLNLEAGIPPQCQPGFIPLAQAHSVQILPLPKIISKTSYDETGAAPSMQRALVVNGINLDQFTSLDLGLGNLAQVGGSARFTSPVFRRSSTANPSSNYSANIFWENMTGGTWGFNLTPKLNLYRQPKSGAAIAFANSQTERRVHDTLWATETDRRRFFLEPSMPVDVRSFTFIAARPTNTGGTPAAAGPKIDGFDPGNRLYLTSGGTTTVGNTSTESQQVLSALSSTAWCTALPQPAPGANGVRTVALGQTTLGDIQWGIKNTGTTAFTGTVTAELRLGGTRVDTLSFTGTLAVGQTFVDTYQRSIRTVAIARESLGPICFHVGLPNDPVTENRGYNVVVTSPGNLQESLRSIP